MPIASDEAAQIPTPIARGVARGLRRRPESHQLVVEREVGTAQRALLRADYELPATLGEKAMIAAGEQFGSILEGDREGGLDRAPMSLDLGMPVPPVCTTSLGAVDLVAGGHLRQRFGAAVSHEDRCLSPGTVGTRVGAPAIGVDRPPKRHPRRLRHPVQRRLRLHLVEAGVECLGCVEGAHRRRLPIARERVARLRLDCQVVPAHDTNVCSQIRRTARPARSRSGGAARRRFGARTGRCPARCRVPDGRRPRGWSPSCPAATP